MASIIKASINLSNIDKSKIIEGKKGKYLPISITINDEVDQFGNQGPVIISQTKEERDNKTAKVYLGKNPKVAAEIEMSIRQKAGVISKKIEGNPLDPEKIEKEKKVAEKEEVAPSKKN